MRIENHSDISYSEALLHKASIMRIPMNGTFELTPVCNMSCDMCYIRQNCKQVEKKGGLRSLEFWERVIDEAVEEGLMYCLLTGGEIFTYPYFKELYEKICTKGVHIVLNTNATLLDEEKVKWLAQFPPRRINISLYGASNETYERLCHLQNGYDRVIRTFELLTEHNIQFRIHGVLVPGNIDDYEGIKKVCNHFGAKLQLVYYMFPPIRKELEQMDMKVVDSHRFAPDKMAEIALMYRREQCMATDNWQEFVEENCDYIEHPEKNVLYGVEEMTCNAGRHSFWVNWKGEVSGCGVNDNYFHDLKKISFKEGWENIVKDTDEIKTSKICACCKYRTICPMCMAASYCETGRADGTPGYLCEFCEKYAELLMEERERLRRM